MGARHVSTSDPHSALVAPRGHGRQRGAGLRVRDIGQGIYRAGGQASRAGQAEGCRAQGQGYRPRSRAGGQG